MNILHQNINFQEIVKIYKMTSKNGIELVEEILNLIIWLKNQMST